MNPSHTLELFFAQNHAALTHLPIACALLAALAAVLALVRKSEDLPKAWAILSIIAVVTVIPTILSGIQAAKGRSYIEQGIFVSDAPENADIKLHQQLGMAGALSGFVMAFLGWRHLRGRKANRILVAVLAISTAILWGATGHMGGKALWSPDTFPAFEQTHTE